MRYIQTFTIIMLFCGGLYQQDFKLSGEYKMEFEEKYNSQNCVITFNDSLYIRKLPSGKTIKGHIIYKKLYVSLKDDDSFLQMDFMKKEITRDTIYFGTTSKDDMSNDNRLIVNLAKLIEKR